MDYLARNQKGQATLEAVVSSMTFLGFTCFLLALFYIGIVRTNLKFISHEFLLCPEYQSSPTCLQKFNHSLNQVIRFGKIQNILYQNSISTRSIEFQIRLNILNIQPLYFSYQDQIQLPLKIK